MERGIAGLLFYEDNDQAMRTPFMHTAQDVRGVSLNSDTLYLANIRAAAATLFTLARPVHPPDIVLYAWRDAGDPDTTVRFQWTGGFPAFDIHRRDQPQDLVNDAYREAEALPDRGHVDVAAVGTRLYYAVEENP